jgi:hypothetical protein
MLGSIKTGAVRAFVTVGSTRGRDASLYRRYAAGLYRQALLTRGDPASADYVVCDVFVNERALARMPERGDDGARYRRDLGALWHTVMRRLASSSAARAAKMLRRTSAAVPAKDSWLPGRARNYSLYAAKAAKQPGAFDAGPLAR